MNWRDIVIGFISALLVTVIGGSIVFYITKEPKNYQKTEKLMYATETIASFSAKKQKFTLFTLHLGNFGKDTARNVDVGVQFSKDTKIIDRSILLSTGPVGRYNILDDEISALKIQFPTLIPNEEVKISFMISDNPTIDPKIGIKSEKTVAIKSSLGKKNDTKNITKINEIVSKLIFPIFLISIIMIIILYRTADRIKHSYYRNLNNTAFLLLHNGLANESKAIFEKEIKEHGAHSHLLSNYALNLVLDGKTEGVNERINVAELMAITKYDKAMVKFNKGLIKLIQNDVESGIEEISNAVELSGSIALYLGHSKIVKDLIAMHPKIQEILNQLIENNKDRKRSITSYLKLFPYNN